MNRRGPGLLGLIFLLQGCGTAPTLAPVTDQGERPHVTAKRHVVAAGDTLFSIAWEYGLDYRDVARYNGISSPYLIHSGQVLRLKPGGAKEKPVVQGPKQVARQQPVTNKPVKKAVKPVLAAKPPSPKPAVSASAGLPKTTSSPVVGYDADNWQWPTNGKLATAYSDKGGGRKGIQISGKQGQPIRAANSGKVVYSGSGLRGYGRLVIIKHDDSYLSAYGQNEWVMVKQGDSIKAGQQIATMGAQHGAAPALYFELRRNGKPINPLRILPKQR